MSRPRWPLWTRDQWEDWWTWPRIGIALLAMAAVVGVAVSTLPDPPPPPATSRTASAPAPAGVAGAVSPTFAPTAQPLGPRARSTPRSAAPSVHPSADALSQPTSPKAGPPAASRPGRSGATPALPGTALVRHRSLYLVQPGDNLSTIAARQLGAASAERALYAVNRGLRQPDGHRLDNPDLIRSGWLLHLPTAARIAAAAARPSSSTLHPSRVRPRAAAGSLPRASTRTAAPTAVRWAALRDCESGGNYATNTGNGHYGAYQFDLATWHSVGGAGLPSNASVAEQDTRALTLYRTRGWEPWTCASTFGS